MCDFGPGGHQIIDMPRMKWSLILALGSTLALVSCIGSNQSAAERQQDADTAAGKAGKAAHSIAKEGEKAARAAGKKLAEAARQAHAGWEEAAREERQKGKK
jgi:type IV secretory pathway TrbL component